MSASAVTLTVTLSTEQIRVIVLPEIRAMLRAERRWLTVAKAARRADVSEGTIYTWLKQGLSSAKRGNVTRIRREVLDRYLMAAEPKKAIRFSLIEKRQAA